MIPAADVRATAAPGFAVHRAPSGLAALEDGWRELAAGVPGSSYFVTPDWVLGSWEAMDASAEAEIAVWAGPDGRVEAVVPLVYDRQRLHRRFPFRVTCWTMLGAATDAADHGLFPALPHRHDEVRAWLRERTGRASLWLPAMAPEADPGLLPPGTRRITSGTCPRLAVGPGIGVGSRSFRRLMARRQRQLDTAGITFRWVPPPEMTADVLDTVLGLHRARRQVAGTTTAFDSGRRDFHLRLQKRAAPGRGPAALIAEHDGRAVGAVYGFLWQNTFAYYNGGWDDAYARMSLGTVLLDRTIAIVAEAGVETFDFLRGDEAYKYRSFGARDHYDEQWLRPRSPAALLAGAALRLHHRRSG
ncbi:GNAT family N-acetyltransferase [Streptomyces sp. NPDC046821]|uniref:GNAT family N-acetyltransferase n=1 Tax=Streptomyces sp. NPDC046821 TaxID=3154702 RepID=UPI0033C03080